MSKRLISKVDTMQSFALEDRVYLERARLFFGNAFGNVSSALLGAALISLVLYSADVPLQSILLWFAITLFFSLSTIYTEMQFKKTPLTHENTSKRLYMRMTPSIFISGMFGLAPFLFGEYLGVQEDMYLFIVFGAMVSVAIVGYITMPFYYTLINCVTMLPLSIYYLLHFEFLYYILTLTAVVWQVLLVSKGWRVSASSIKAIRLNEELHDEIEHHKKTKEDLHQLATHDTLTDLPNRSAYTKHLKLAIENAESKEKHLALLFIDLDHFKEINDSLGHMLGDNVLKIVTKRLQNVLRHKETIARLGGDEFTVILEKIDADNTAAVVAQKIIDAIAEPIHLENQVFYISASIGISVYPHDSLKGEDLLKFADSAMYKAKEEGRNNFQYYSKQMTYDALERVTMTTNLREALDKKEFLVYFQPQVDVSVERIVGLEALVRWNHPSKGVLSPASFIPLAESTGLIVKIDRMVMDIAMQQFSQWLSEGLYTGVLAMNLSVKQLKQKDFVHYFESLIQKYDIKAELLELEVTESHIMSQPQEAIEMLSKLSDLGVSLAVDDFGTGYSSLAYLKSLPINKLKIDREFIKDLPDDEEDAGITKAIIDLAHSLKLKITAEGVETKGQQAFVVANGCDNIQGYFYYEPSSASDLEEILKKQ